MSRALALAMIVAVLNMSIDGAIDSLQAHPHDDPPAGQVDAPDGGDDLASDAQGDLPAPTADHCEHCCHGHLPALTASTSLVCEEIAREKPLDGGPWTFTSTTSAPPTPPPTA